MERASRPDCGENHQVRQAPIKFQLGVQNPSWRQEATGRDFQIKINIIPVIPGLVKRPIFLTGQGAPWLNIMYGQYYLITAVRCGAIVVLDNFVSAEVTVLLLKNIDQSPPFVVRLMATCAAVSCRGGLWFTPAGLRLRPTDFELPSAVKKSRKTTFQQPGHGSSWPSLVDDAGHGLGQRRSQQNGRPVGGAAVSRTLCRAVA